MTRKTAVLNVSAPATEPASSSIPKQLAVNKRPQADPKASTDRKRQKVKDTRLVQAGAALKSLSIEWKAKAAVAADLRLKTVSEEGTRLEELASVWNATRAADGRPAMTPAQIALIPADENLLSLFKAMFTSPLTWDPSLFQTVLKQQQDLGAIASEQVQYYIRRLSFAGQAELKDLLEKVRTAAPQYEGQIDMLLAASDSAILGPLLVSYSGFTVANTPVGRDLDDTAASDSEIAVNGFLKTILKHYNGAIAVYEVLPLAFEIGNGGRDSVKKSRNDLRTALFESLLIDSFGFLCLNTAAAGTLIEPAVPADIVRMNSGLQARLIQTSRQPFSWQSSGSA